MPITVESLRAEEARIQNAYARRRNGDLYSLFNVGHLFMMQERETRFLRLLARHGVNSLEHKKILEIGCGSGNLLRDFVRWGAQPENMTGVDLLPDRVSEALRLCPAGMQIQEGNAARLQFPNRHFDLVVQSTVFTSVLDKAVKKEIAAEMRRVMKPDGLILWFDYHMNNPRNPDVMGVKAREIRTLFPGCRIHLERVTLAPPIVRLLAPHSWLLCYFLSRIPWLCSHYIGVIRKA
jgi:SAM-dependent methyltransferase